MSPCVLLESRTGRLQWCLSACTHTHTRARARAHTHRRSAPKSQKYAGGQHNAVECESSEGQTHIRPRTHNDTTTRHGSVTVTETCADSTCIRSREGESCRLCTDPGTWLADKRLHNCPTIDTVAREHRVCQFQRYQQDPHPTGRAQDGSSIDRRPSSAEGAAAPSVVAAPLSVLAISAARMSRRAGARDRAS